MGRIGCGVGLVALGLGGMGWLWYDVVGMGVMLGVVMVGWLGLGWWVGWGG